MALVVASVPQVTSGENKDESLFALSVSDDGPGLKQSEYEEALKRGARLDEATPGTGFGLAIVDDLIATGGTALASVELLRQAGAVVEHALFVIDLPDLAGADKLRDAGVDVATLIEFEGD